MGIHFKHFSSICLFLCLLMSAADSLAQRKIQILKFSEIKRGIIDGESIQKLYDVRLASDDFEMICDSAWQFLERDEIRAFGNIQVDTEGKKIWADTLNYFTDRDFTQLRGRVIIATDTTTIFTESADYIFSLELAQFKENVRLEDIDGGLLLANEGEYFQQQDSAVFRGDVQLADSSQYAEGDSLYFNRPTNSFEFFGDVFAVDSTENAVSMGDYFAGDSTGQRLLQGNAYLRRIVNDTTAIDSIIQRDTTHITAREILLFEEDSTTFTHAYGNVKIWSQKFSSVSDTSLYNNTTEIFQLRSNPKTWNKNIQLTGPYIEVQLDSNNVKKLTSHVGPFVVQQDTATGRFNQIKGDTLIVDFEEGEIEKLTAFPNSEIFYHTKDENGEPDGAIKAETPQTIIYFQNGEPQTVKMAQNTGVFIPEGPAVPQQRLPGFAWNPDMRPKRPNINAVSKYPAITSERPFELPRRYLEFLNENENDQ